MPESRAFLTTYRPLCRTKFGRVAIQNHLLPPFLDGSCRREPDLDAQFPSITSLCRGGMFAPRLREGDRVAYITKQGRYDAGLPAHWRLTALLVVNRRFESHAEAAAWFQKERLPLPRNCVVAGNAPAQLDQTDGELNRELRKELGRLTDEEIIEQWDRGYRFRALRWGALLVCKPLFRELRDPPAISRDDWQAWNGGVPFTRTTPEITEELWQRLEERAATHGPLIH
jgi:hypothetical protein